MTILNMVGGSSPSPIIPPYLCFTAEVDDSSVGIRQYGSPTAVSLETSTDGSTWTSYTIGNNITLASEGDKVFFRTTSTTDTTFSIGISDSYRFQFSGIISASGDVTSLLNKNGTNTVPDWAFYGLFMNCKNLIKPPQLPATTVGYQSYRNMFNASGIIKAPDLPATTVGNYGYSGMFRECNSLTKAAVMSSITLGDYACSSMYYQAQGLVTATPLPATTVGTACYQQMFYQCSYLTRAPSYIGATTLSDTCCDRMFYQCLSLLTAARMDATATSANCCKQMYFQCSNLEQLPNLLPLTLADSCYETMFRGCSKIKLSTTQVDDYQTEYRIPKTGTGTSGTHSTYLFLLSTGGTFTGDPAVNTTYYTSNTLV